MDTNDTRYQEGLDRLTILLASKPRPGWEHIFEEVSRREVERVNPLSKPEGMSKEKAPPGSGADTNI